jgi:hypothetical protein
MPATEKGRPGGDPIPKVVMADTPDRKPSPLNLQAIPADLVEAIVWGKAETTITVRTARQQSGAQDYAPERVTGAFALRKALAKRAAQ